MQIQNPVGLNVLGARKAAMAFIYVTVILDVLALGIIIPVFPRLVVGFSGNTAQGAEIYGLFIMVWGLMQFVCSPLLGALSDRFGRRPVLILSGFGLGFDYIIMAIAPNLSWLFVGRVLSGITSASYATASAYVADVTSPERRAGAFGMVGVAWGIGFILGPALGGVLGGIQLRFPFWFAATLSLVSASYGLLVLPESLGWDSPAVFMEESQSGWLAQAPSNTSGTSRIVRGNLPQLSCIPGSSERVCHLRGLPVRMGPHDCRPYSDPRRVLQHRCAGRPRPTVHLSLRGTKRIEYWLASRNGRVLGVGLGE